ncbi:MAG: multidrug effflux MFS transporter [Pikeienuella sp.]
MTPPSRQPIQKPKFAMLAMLAGLSVLSLNMFLPALPAIAVDLEADYAVVNLAIAGYLGVTALMQLIMGPLSDYFGRRPVLLVALAIFALASLGCLLATDIVTFLVCRMAQCAISAGWAISMAMIRDTETEGRAASLMGYVSMTMAVAPMLGPVIGGGLADAFGWRACFTLYTALGGGLFLWCRAAAPETNQNRSATFREQARTYPILLRSSAFWAFSLCMTFAIGSFYAFLAGAPLVAQALFGMSPGTLGVWLGSITAGFMAGTFMSGRFAASTPRATMILSGRVIGCVGLSAGLLVVLTGYIAPLTLFGACIFVGIGNGLTTPSASAGAMSVRPDLAGGASGLLGALVVAGGALITTITGTLLTAFPSAVALLLIMLSCAAISLIAALAIKANDNKAK